MELKSPLFRPNIVSKSMQFWLFIPLWLLAIPLFIYLLSGLGHTSIDHSVRLVFLAVVTFFYFIAVVSQAGRAFTPIFITVVVFFDLLVVSGVLGKLLLFVGSAGVVGRIGYFMLIGAAAAEVIVTPFVALIGGLVQLPVVVKKWQRIYKKYWPQ